MESNTTKWPAYAKFSSILLGTVALFAILYAGRDILVPLIFATIVAILLNPFVNFLCRKGLNRIIAIAIAVLTSLILIVLLMYFIVSQTALLSDSFPQFKEKFNLITHQTVDWVSSNLNISKPKINSWIAETKAKIMSNSTPVIGSAFLTVGGTLAYILLLPVYIFMILFYKPLLLEFITQLSVNGQRKIVDEILTETKSLVQSYLIGLLLEAAIVAVLNSVGLLILGIQYAILFGIIGALLNMIPYIGGIIATAIPMLMAIATKDPIYALWVLGLFLLVQFIDNNLIVPRIVASKVQVNALVSIVVVLIGGALWGVAGMFLALPLTAIIKVVCDRVPDLKAFGYLIGDDQPVISGAILHPKKAKAKAKARTEESSNAGKK